MIRKFWRQLQGYFLVGIGLVILLLSCQNTPVSQSQPTAAIMAIG